MNLSTDRETGIIGIGLTQEDAVSSMKFRMELNGHLTAKRKDRRDVMRAWLPDTNILHVKGVGAISYANHQFTNLRTGKVVNIRELPMSHYLYLFDVFDGYINFDDFTLTIGPEVDTFLRNISDKFLELKNFPYIKPVENLQIKHLHSVSPGVSVIETPNNSIVTTIDSTFAEVDKTLGVDNKCLLAYLFSSMGYMYDGKELRRIRIEDDSL